jgi:hypothetical protein
MPGAGAARTVMIIVAVIVVVGLVFGMMATSAAITPN